jgi:hypothetical protein
MNLDQDILSSVSLFKAPSHQKNITYSLWVERQGRERTRTAPRAPAYQAQGPEFKLKYSPMDMPPNVLLPPPLKISITANNAIKLLIHQWFNPLIRSEPSRSSHLSMTDPTTLRPSLQSVSHWGHFISKPQHITKMKILETNVCPSEMGKNKQKINSITH